jgi:uncharacterized protein (TIGR03067 family)
MRLTALAIVLTAATFAAGQQPQQPAPLTPAVRRALAVLQGTWHFDAMEQDGQNVAAAELKGRTLFVGGDLLLIRDGDRVLYGGKVTIDPNVSPATFNVAAQQDQKLVDVMVGIYEIRDDTFRLAFVSRGGERPTEFKSDPGSKVRLATCRRLRMPGEDVDIAGVYTARSTGIDGKSQESQAHFERRGDSYIVTYRQGQNVVYAGVAIRQGDTLSLAWGTKNNQVGVCLYKIEKGPRLVGTYTTFAGPGLVLPEVLTRTAVID